MRIVFSCGGTGGHINPALAVADAVRRREPNTAILFIGAENGMETKLVPREGFELRVIKAQNLRHSLSPSAFVWNARTMALMRTSLRETRRILREFVPDIVVGTGGFACFPAVYEATKLGIPSLLHESNAIPGVTTKLLAKRVERVMVGFEGVENAYPRPDRVIVTGTPVREAFIYMDKEKARASLELDSRPVVASFFGSVGARDINHLFVDFIRNMGEDFQLVHVTGRLGYTWMTQELSRLSIPFGAGKPAKLLEYAYDMPSLMAAADLVICRSGASTLSELTVSGKPAILIPSPNVVADHQEKNARKLAETGGVEVLPEGGLNSSRLLKQTKTLLHNTEKLDKMAEALHRAAIFDSTERILELIKRFRKGSLAR